MSLDEENKGYFITASSSLISDRVLFSQLLFCFNQLIIRIMTATDGSIFHSADYFFRNVSFNSLMSLKHQKGGYRFKNLEGFFN